MLPPLPRTPAGVAAVCALRVDTGRWNDGTSSFRVRASSPYPPRARSGVSDPGWPLPRSRSMDGCLDTEHDVFVCIHRGLVSENNWTATVHLVDV